MSRHLRASRLMVFLLLCSMLATAVLVALPSPAASSPVEPSRAAEGRPVVYEVDGVRYHLMTEQEMLSMRDRIGVRQEGLDYNVLVDGLGTGLAPPTDEEWNAMVGRAGVAEEAQPDLSALPSAYDLSSQPYFPAVRSQGSQGSCGAWASIYYAYGYLEAKDNGWTDAKAGTNPSHLMSPAWTYNKVNGGSDKGSWMSWNFQVAIDWGVASLANHPYNENDDLGWGGPTAFREAPLHRAASYVYHDLRGDAAVNQVKAMVAENRPLTFALNSGYYLFDNGQYVVTSSEYDSTKALNHAQTVVGYDDAIIEDGEVGAFRVVNSWGPGWGDGGYYWLTYAAFKELCAHSDQALTEVVDRADYSPSLLATWHFNDAPVRKNFSLNLGAYPSSTKELSPYFVTDAGHDFPSFMCLDISDFREDFAMGASEFWIDLEYGSGTLNSFKVESYEQDYVPGVATQTSAQSPDVPRSVPCHPTVIFSRYDSISCTAALDYPGTLFSSSGQAAWTAVPQTSFSGSSSMQSGDVGDGSYSSLRTTVTSTRGVSFYWKVSSEAGKDCLRFSVDGVQKETASGVANWTKRTFYFGPGAHVLEWNYTRDLSYCGNADTVWVDKVVMIPEDDSYEENDAPAQASALPPSGTYSGLIGLDDDWYRLKVEADDLLTVRMELNDSLGDLDLYLYGPDGTTLIDSSETNGSSETVAMRAPSTDEFLLKVEPDAGQFSRYSLTFDYEPGALDYGRNSSLEIISGSGDLASVMPNKSVELVPGGSLVGTIVLRATVAWPTSETVPLIATRNWGEPSSSFHEVAADVPNGVSEISADVSITVPSAPGTYFLAFAFRNESSSAHVASATDDSVGTPVWGDGNDIAVLSQVQIGESRATGRALGAWLRTDGTHLVSIPSDVLLLHVEPPDTVPPVTSAVLNGTAGSSGWYRSSVTISLSATDPGSGVAMTLYRIDGGAWTPYSGPFPLAGQGLYRVDYYSIDELGNEEGVRSAEIKIDQDPPTTALSLSGASGGNGWFIGDVWLNLTASDALSGMQSTFYRIDAGTWRRYLTGTCISVEGKHQLDYYSTDIAGNPEPMRRASLPIDRSAPKSNAIINGAEGAEGWYHGPVSVQLYINDTLSGPAGLYYNLDEGGWKEYSGQFNVSSQGSHTLRFNSSDLAGNIESSQGIDFGIDTEAPEIDASIIGIQGQNGWYASAVQVELVASDGLSGLLSIEYALDGGPWQGYSSTLSLASPGTHVLDYRASDTAGNENQKRLTIMVDDSPPDVVLEPQGEQGIGDWYVSEVALMLNGTDVGSDIACYHYRIDSGEWHQFSGDVVLNDDGEHLIEAYASDNAGNVGPSKSIVVRIDRGAPSTLLALSGTEGRDGWYVSCVVIELNATDLVSGTSLVLYSISEGPWELYDGAVTIAEDGVYELRCYSRDVAGNQEAPWSRTIRVDTISPVTTSDAQGLIGEHGWFVSPVTVTLDPDDNGSGPARTSFQIDGGQWANYSAPMLIGEGGVHHLRYFTVDVAGNKADPVDMVLKLDLMGPLTSATLEGERGDNGWYVGPVSFDLSALDEDSGPLVPSWRLDGGAWTAYGGAGPVATEGSHVLEYRTQDQAGNWEGPRQTAFKIDLSRPSIRLNGTGAVFTSRDLEIHFEASDNVSSVASVEASIDAGKPYIIDQEPWDLEALGLSDGWHTLEVTVYDEAGNSMSQTFSLKVDTNPLSPEGPFGPWLVIAVVALALAVAVAALLLRNGRRWGKAP